MLGLIAASSCRAFFDAHDTEGRPDPQAWLDVAAVSGPPFITRPPVRYPASVSGRIVFDAIQGSTVEINGDFSSPPLPQTVVVPALESCDLSQLVVWPPSQTPGPPPAPPPSWAELQAEANAAGYTLCMKHGAVLVTSTDPNACIFGEVVYRFEGKTFTEIEEELDEFLASQPPARGPRA